MPQPKRTQSELRRIVKEARADYKDLDKVDLEFVHKVEDGTFNYEAMMPASLGPPVILKRTGLSEKVNLFDSILSWPYRINVDLGKEGDNTVREEDMLELFFRDALDKADPDGDQFGRARNHLIRSRFGALLVTINPYKPPKPNEAATAEVNKARKEAYDAEYSRYRLEALNPSVIGMVERGGHESMTVIEEAVPLLSLCDPAEGEEDLSQLEIFEKRYGASIHDSDGTPVDASTDFGKKTIHRLVLDDGEWVTTYIEQNNRDGSKHYQNPKAYPNTFGRPSVIILKGYERPHAPIAQRYQPMITPWAIIEHRLTVMESIAMTVAANPQFALEVNDDARREINTLIRDGIDPKLVKADISQEYQEKSRKGRRVVPAVRGKLADISTKLGPEFQLAYTATLEQARDLDTRLMMFNPPPETIEKATAASVYAGIEAGMRTIEKPLRSIEAARAAFFRMVAHDIVHDLNPHLKWKGPDSELDKMSKFRVRKGESNKFKAGAYEIPPKLFDLFPSPARVTTEVQPGGEAHKAARVKMAMEMESSGHGTPGDVQEAYGYQDVTGRLRAILSWNNAQLLGAGLAKLSMVDAIRFIAWREGRSAEQMIATLLPELAQEPGPTRLDALGIGGGYRPSATPTPAAATPGA